MYDYPQFLKELENKYNCSIKVKGDIGKPNAFNKSLVIIKKALVNYLLEGKSIYDTINENQKLIDYQIIKKRTALTVYINYNDMTTLPDKVLRMFPVTKDGVKILTDKGSAIPDVPESVVIMKDNIIGKTISDIPNFDINYYIDAFNNQLKDWIPEELLTNK